MVDERKESFWWLTTNGENIPIYPSVKDSIVKAVREATRVAGADLTHFPVFFEFLDIHDGLHIIDLKMAMTFDECTPELREARNRHARQLQEEFPEFQ